MRESHWCHGAKSAHQRSKEQGIEFKLNERCGIGTLYKVLLKGCGMIRKVVSQLQMTMEPYYFSTHILASNQVCRQYNTKYYFMYHI